MTVSVRRTHLDRPRESADTGEHGITTKHGRDSADAGAVSSKRPVATGVLPPNRDGPQHAWTSPPAESETCATNGQSKGGSAPRARYGFCADAWQWPAHRQRLGIRGCRTGAPDPGRGNRVMFGLGPATKIYIAIEGVDMRKGFDGLFGLVRDRLGQDPLSGHLFLFANRARGRLKVLVWDGSGLWVCAKRLEKGRFRWPAAQDGSCIVMRPEELAMLVNGLDLAEARLRPNWLRRAPAA